MSAKSSQEAMPIAIKENVGTITVNKKLYSADVLFGTAFGFLDRAYIQLDVVDKDRIKVEIEARSGIRFSLKELVGEFKNELVNQALRVKLAKQTEEVRTMIVGRAIGLSIPADAPAPALLQYPSCQTCHRKFAKLLAEEEDSLDFWTTHLESPFHGKKSTAKKTVGPRNNCSSLRWCHDLAIP